jgi:hypothetical protein
MQLTDIGAIVGNNMCRLLKFIPNLYVAKPTKGNMGLIVAILGTSGSRPN